MRREELVKKCNFSLEEGFIRASSKVGDRIQRLEDRRASDVEVAGGTSFGK
jgi:hypothetical protein